MDAPRTIYSIQVKKLLSVRSILVLDHQALSKKEYFVSVIDTVLMMMWIPKSERVIAVYLTSWMKQLCSIFMIMWETCYQGINIIVALHGTERYGTMQGRSKM